MDKQKELDLKKWYDSEKAGLDTCGTYDYCKDCDKNVENPCATAYAKTVTVVATVKKTTTRKPCAKKTTTATLETKAKKTATKTTTKATTKTAAKKTTKK